MNFQPATPPPFTAVFDWDGVVIDSEECHREGWQRLARELGRQFPAGWWEKTFGRKNVEIISEVLGWTRDPAEITRLTDRKEVFYREVVRSPRSPPPASPAASAVPPRAPTLTSRSDSSASRRPFRPS
ncbi:MAG: hypothetical protein NTZ16_02040 [Verrucomicrobia bacterium]|nr:hypothetical protein [Verrucomicrobiota bacterium]